MTSLQPISPEGPPRRRLHTVSGFSRRHPAFTEASLRWIIHCAKPRHGAQSLIPPNGFERAIVYNGRRVLLDEDRFFECLDQQSARGEA